MREEVLVVDEERTYEPAEAKDGVIRLAGNTAAFVRYAPV